MPEPSTPAHALSFVVDGERIPQALVMSFSSLMEAELARGRLEVEGIAARIVDGNIVGMHAAMSGVVGGVKLWVAQEHLAVAREALLPPRHDDDDTANADDGPHTPRASLVRTGDDHAQRAFRTAVLGVVLFPPLLNIYSITLAVRALHDGATLSPRSRRRVVGAVVVDSVVAAAVALIVAQLLR